MYHQRSETFSTIKSLFVFTVCTIYKYTFIFLSMCYILMGELSSCFIVSSSLFSIPYHDWLSPRLMIAPIREGELSCWSFSPLASSCAFLSCPSPILLAFLITLSVWDAFFIDLKVCFVDQCNDWECSISCIASSLSFSVATWCKVL